ncbi:MAG TPA: pyridoxal phosphate-dependent aminotransferase [Bryobacteraceae bacterium]|nr:pyridoxal phosphate-dependent aminotransferase [Bryobacteraceae bacterium]
MSGIGVDQAGNRADSASDPDILRLENLDTDVPPHPSVIAATAAAIADDRNNSYLPFTGQQHLRQAVAAHVSRLSGVPYDPGRNVLISAGGLSGILNVLLAIIEPGDEVILTDPIYIGLLNRVRLAGGVPKLVPLLKSGREWALDRDALQQAVSEKTRAFLLMSPSMPSGAYLTRADWEAIAAVVRDRGLWLIYDAAMERILFDGRPVIHPASLPGIADRVITVGSASKELRMIGWRVGWIVAPERLVPDLALVTISNVVVPVGIAQQAAAVALELGDADVRDATAIWEARRDCLLAELEGLPVMRPAGGWSLLIDAEKLGTTAGALSERLFEKAKIAATPLSGWGSADAARYLRLVFANEPMERLRGIGRRFRLTLA